MKRPRKSGRELIAQALPECLCFPDTIIIDAQTILSWFLQSACDEIDERRGKPSDFIKGLEAFYLEIPPESVYLLTVEHGSPGLDGPIAGVWVVPADIPWIDDCSTRVRIVIVFGAPDAQSVRLMMRAFARALTPAGVRALTLAKTAKEVRSIILRKTDDCLANPRV